MYKAHVSAIYDALISSFLGRVRYYSTLSCETGRVTEAEEATTDKNGSSFLHADLIT